MKFKKLSSLLAVAALSASILVGCGAKAEETTTENGLKTGTYTAKGTKDDKGYTAEIEITVADGKISAVKYDEKDEAGVSKLDNTEYNEKMKAKSGVSPIEAYPQLQDSLVEKQDVASVDAVTGATKSTESFKTLAEEALSTAK